MSDSLEHFARALESSDLQQTPISTVNSRDKQITWSMLRLDLVDAQLSGNKAFKLLPALLAAKEQGKATLISFGGFHSNHIHALAAAGRRFGFKTVGIIRGYLDQPLSPTLIDVQSFGMQLHFVGRQEYKLRNEQAYQQQWLKKYDKALLIPEGAAGPLGLQGSQFLANLIVKNLAQNPFDTLCVPAGTGNTAAGLIQSGLFKQKDIYVFAALKREAIHQLVENLPPHVRLLDDYCFGGFAKMPEVLLRFMLQFEKDNGLLLDPVYTAKMAYGIDDLIANDVFSPGTHIVSLHTGGLQGRRFIHEKLGNLLQAGELIG
ncbi:MAG: pyridoxal-phosphate dependent enzyme [Pseudomonadales bacterium]|nr:pyridoxal-phosphate dependent enzyme [Pseudomonadales bacterium]